MARVPGELGSKLPPARGESSFRYAVQGRGCENLQSARCIENVRDQVGVVSESSNEGIAKVPYFRRR